MSAHNFQYETVALARECESFVEGSDWSRSTFSTLYRRVQEHMAGQYGRGQGLYRYKNATLIDQLEITPDEERHMKTLISRSEKDRRWNDRRRDPRREASKSGARNGPGRSLSCGGLGCLRGRLRCWLGAITPPWCVH